MGVFTFLLLVLLSIESFALPKDHDKQDNYEKFSISGKKWVVLVAGSDGWINYRHQADICHAYHIMIRNGIPKENIITMMVDDIANNERNPTPGKIINQPNGTDVYNGVVIDYKGDDVNPTNFLNVIKGNKTGMASIGSGKVVEGGHRDTIFINFVDHGSTGLLCFPNEYLFADQLNDALNTMFTNKFFKKALLYIEACESGSMFDGIISDNTNVLAITASGPREGSYACYCKSQSGPYETCLGDLFSVTWMEDLDNTVYELSAKKRSIFNDYKEVRTNVTDSNIMIYGDFDIGHEKLSTFIGYYKEENVKTKKSRTMMTKKNETLSSRSTEEATIRYSLENKEINSHKKHELAMMLLKNNEMRLIIDGVLREIYSKVLKIRPDIKNEVGEFDKPKNLDLSLNMFPCYRSIINKISKTCFSMPRNPYVLDRLKIFANLCIIDNQINKLVDNVVDQTIFKIPKNIINVF